MSTSRGSSTARILPVELSDPRFYHVDIVFCPLDSRTALYAPTALDADSARAIEELVPDAIALTADEAAAFSANAVVVGRTVVMPACSPRLEALLRERGFEPVVVDVSEFLKAGGGPRCLTLALDVKLGEQDAAAVADRYTAHNYHPLPVTVSHAEGAWVTDDRGRRHLDALSAYCALNFGHRHPKLVAAAREQLDRVTLTSRAFSNDQLGPFARDLAALCGKDRVLPMNTGAEAVETAIKTARKWGYEVKGVRPDRRRSSSATATSTAARRRSCPSPTTRSRVTASGRSRPGFVRVPFGDAAALAAALEANEDVVAFLVEPVQGEAGVIVPPDGYLREARRLCTQHDVLLIADEIQSGLGRTGRTFACDHDEVVPDIYVLGKALGGGILALSAVVADDAVLGVFGPGLARLDVRRQPARLRRRPRGARAAAKRRAAGQRGAHRRADARALDLAAPPALTAVRSRGLWFGLDLAPDERTARAPPASSCSPRACWQRTRTSTRSASRRR